jgi:hypothetical protein
MKTKILALLLLSLVMACKKPPVSYCTQYPDDCVDVREVKDYFYFNYGSWWVYVEENSGKRDSVYVTETSSDPHSVLFSTEVFSSFDEHYSNFWTTGVDPYVKNNIAHKSERSTRVMRAKWKPGGGGFLGEASCFIFYPTPGLWTYFNGGGYIGYNNILKIDSVFNFYSINSVDFENVVKVTEEHTRIEGSQPTNHYYSPNVGLIKKELIDSNHIWNLVDYHIEK